MINADTFLGKKFNRWTILNDLGQIKGSRVVLALCECGTKKEVSYENVKSGKSKSCGCLSIENHTIHGIHKHKLYEVWEGMVDRCYNPKHNKYHRYGGRGVKMCEEWRHDPKAFYDWAIDKWKPGLSLDKDKLSPNRLGDLYCPEYCCFLTRKENSMYRNNSRIIEFKGEEMCVSQFASRINLNYGTVQSRLRYGWTPNEIAETPLFKYNKKAS